MWFRMTPVKDHDVIRHIDVEVLFYPLDLVTYLFITTLKRLPSLIIFLQITNATGLCQKNEKTVAIMGYKGKSARTF